MSERDIELVVEIVNLRYLFRGIEAIKDLKEFCDTHASVEIGYSVCEAAEANPPIPTVGALDA